MTSRVRIDCAITEQSNPGDEAHIDFNQIYELARKTLSEQIRCSENDLLLARRLRVTWPKGELEDHETEGFQIIIESDQYESQYCLHTNLDTKAFICRLHKVDKLDILKRLEIFMSIPRCHIL